MDNERSVSKSGSPLKHFLKIYVAPVGKEEIRSVGHPERDRQIAAASNGLVAREKYCAWLLLEHALLQTVGVGVDGAGLRHHENGGWLSDVCHLSISHSGGYVAVAVSSAPVGVDIETLRQRGGIDSLAARWLSESERRAYYALPDGGRAEFFYEKWTKKESIFKRGMGRSLSPAGIECDLYPTVTWRLDLGTDRLVVSACADGLSSAELLTVGENVYKNKNK